MYSITELHYCLMCRNKLEDRMLRYAEHWLYEWE